MPNRLAACWRDARGKLVRTPNDIRLWAKVAGPWNTPGVGDDDCWYFGGRAKNRWGYPRFRWTDDEGSRLIGAHVAAFILVHGPVPAGQVVCHRCDHKMCCNPSHHFAGTQKTNMRDMAAKGRQWRQQQQRARAAA